MRPKGPVLVVDDDEAILDVVQMVLSEAGYEVLTAADGAEALAAADRRPPRVILLDMRMPVMDGWQFARAYRQAPGPHAPIVVVTAAVDAARRAAEVDAEDVLPKPFRVEELLAVVDRYAEPR
ncbi:MAG TPA: response regulator [Chloroflexota bacterium]|nr:response regulator [Chloroflexota bacterium]